MWRTLLNLQGPWTGYLSARTPSNMANPQCFPCSAPHALHQKWSSWTQLLLTTSRHRKWWRTMGNWGYTQSPMMWPRIPILRFMERMADHWCNMGIFHMFRKWWWNHTLRISMLIPPINEPAIMPNKEIPTVTFTFDLVNPHILAQTLYICPTPPLPPTSLQHIAQKASTMFRGALPSEEIFIAPLSWQPPVWLPCILFKLIFPLLKTSPQSSPIIHLGQQIQCIASYIDLVNKVLYDSVEPRRYWYLPDSELWYDSILKLKWDFTFNFDYLENAL